MGNLLTSLLNSTNALSVFSRGLQVVQNDVTNISTPGYVKQTQTFEALSFDLATGQPGGVAAGPVENSRDVYAEQSVRGAQSVLGLYGQQAADLAQLSSLFDISGKSGIGPAINSLFNSFSQLSVTPNDSVARQGVLSNAITLTQTIHQTASGLASGSQQVAIDAKSSVSAINSLASTIAQINGQGLRDARGNVNAGLDAKLNASLEQLAQYTNFTALQEQDGSVSVYIGGQTPLVVKNQVDAIEGDFSSAQAAILDSTGKDITSQITQGQLAGSLDTYNNKLPSYLTSLNTLAQGIADQVNAGLSNGVDQNGLAPTEDLFTYDTTNGAAQSLTVNSALTTDQIAAASPDNPGGNDNALSLAALGSSITLSGTTFAGYYGIVGSQVGRDIANAQSSQDTQVQVLAQAQNLRSQVSSVSLDEEAARLIQFQAAYQAITKMVTVLDNLTSTVINMISGN